MATWFKFLAAGATGPFSGFRWPRPSPSGEPGDWTGTTRPLDPCRVGLHLCRAQDLPLWLNAELYLVEADDPVEEYDGFVLTSRARLLRQVTDWSPGTARRFGEACVWEVRRITVRQLREAGREQDAVRLSVCSTTDQLAQTAREVSEADAEGSTLAGYALDLGSIQAHGDGWATAAAATAFVAATAARTAAAPGAGDEAMSRERSRQARWLLEELAGS